jgi:hypothetical protein
MEENVIERVSENDTRVLTEDMFSTLLKMIRSNDPGDHTMAQLMLIQVDVEKSIYYIWKLAKAGIVYNMVNLRTKAGRKLRDDTSLFFLANAHEVAFAKFLKNRGWLTPELYQKLKPGIMVDMKLGLTHEFYDIHVTIKPEFKHLDEKDQLKKL